MRNTFLVITVKKWLKSVLICWSYSKNKSGVRVFCTTLYCSKHIGTRRGHSHACPLNDRVLSGICHFNVFIEMSRGRKWGYIVSEFVESIQILRNSIQSTKLQQRSYSYPGWLPGSCFIAPTIHIQFCCSNVSCACGWWYIFIDLGHNITIPKILIPCSTPPCFTSTSIALIPASMTPI